jgi:hypothetical protein
MFAIYLRNKKMANFVVDWNQGNENHYFLSDFSSNNV